MQKSKYYYKIRFPLKVIEEAYNEFISLLNNKIKTKPTTLFSVIIEPEEWEFDTIEEFFAEFPKADKARIDYLVQHSRITVDIDKDRSYVSVGFDKRAQIESVFRIFERNVNESKIFISSKPINIFIGHGHNTQWKDLKDHLHEKHGFKVVAYEIGPRAGKSIKDVLEDMLEESSFALLVLTGEDLHIDGELHARENVIHELGLFQGRIGFAKAIALLEESVKEFSNILGINQIRFSKGDIKETFGEVLATIKREFKNGD